MASSANFGKGDGGDSSSRASSANTMEGDRRRKSFIRVLFDAPRRSVGSIKERLEHSRFGTRKRMSRSDTSLLKSRHRLRNKLKSSASIQSARSVLDIISKPTKKVPITKWSQKLYGSHKAIMEEHEKVLQAGSFVIHPFSNFRLTWDILLTILIISNIVFIPMDIAFAGEVDSMWSIVFKLVSDFWFMADIALNFRTGIQISSADKTGLTLNPKEIAERYLKSWFVVDLIASFPFDFIARFFLNSKQSKAMSFLRIVKAVSIVKAARIPRLIRGIHHWEEVFNLQYDFAVSVLRFGYLISFIFFTCHLNGCLQYMVPMFYEFPADTWVKMRGLDHPNVTWWEAYSWSIFKATSQMLCLGYSQIIPVGMIDLWMTMWSQIAGAIIFAIFIGNAINLMEEMDATKNAYKMKINQIQEYLGFRRIPLKLRREVLDYCEMRYMGKLFDEQQILKELSPVLRREVIWHNTASLIQSVPLWEEVDDEFVYDLGGKLMYSVYMPDEYIVTEKTKAMHMFFISRGEVEIRSASFINTLSDGAHFGESCLFSGDLRRSANVVALSVVHIYTLSRTDYVKTLLKFPEESNRINDCGRRIRQISSRYDFIKRHNSYY